MVNIVYRKILAPRELPQQILAPPPPGKSLDAKAPGWGQIFGANPGCAGGMVMDEIDTCTKTKRKLQQFTVSGWLIMNGGESGTEKRNIQD